MIRKLLVSTVLMVALAGCNLPGDSSGGINPAATDNPQESAPPAEATIEGTLTPIPVVPIPTSSIQIDGVPYTAYQIPGDPFRFVCQDPCPLDQQYIYAEYAGFRVAHAMMIELTGVDTLAELQPVDMHLVFEDSICSFHPSGHAYVYSFAHQAYTCTDGPGWYPTQEEKIQMAGRVEGQYFPLHEYMHTIFFGRISGIAGGFRDDKAAFFHDFVGPLPSFTIGIMDPSEFCSYSTVFPPGDYGGALSVELCRQNGFELTNLAQSLIELDNLYQSGGGQVPQAGYEHPAATISQYRDILNSLLGGDTTNAFAEACWPPELFGSSYSIPVPCPRGSTTATTTPIK